MSSGIFYMVMAAFFFSLMSVLVKLSGQVFPPQELVLARSILAFGITAALIKRKGLPLWGRNRRLLFLRGVFGFVGLSAFYYTLTTMPIADSVTLQYTSPLFTGMIAHHYLKEKSAAREWMYFLLAFLGILLIIRPGYSLHTIPAVIGLGGAFFAGLAYNTVRKLRATDDPLSIVLYFPLVSMLFSAPLVAPVFVMPRGMQWLILAGIGLTALIAQLFLTNGLHRERAARAMNVSYIGLVFSTLWGIFLFDEIPDWRTIAGAMITVFAIIKIARSGAENVISEELGEQINKSD